MLRTRILVALATAALLAVPAGQALADGGSDPSVTIGSVVRNGGTATVTGVAAFPAITSPQDVGGSDTEWADASTANAAGIDLQKGSIVPLADGSGLRFIWTLSGLPAQIPPEVVRYTWTFAIGTNVYQLQAKRTNMASITTIENPVGHIKQLAAQKNFFQLRGDCQASYEGAPVAGCYHLAFLNGNFDIANKTVSMDLPFNTRDDIGRLVAADFKPGAVLLESESATMSIAAAFQAVIGNTSTSDFINTWNPYFTAPTIQLGVGGPDADPTAPELYTATAKLEANGSFTGTVSGLSTGNNTIYLRACNGESCTYATL